MVYITDFPSEERMDLNRSESSMLRTPAIINERENEDRVVNSENTLRGDGEAEIPRVGMTFNSFEEVKDFYKQYAAGKGFTITTRSTKCDTGGKMKYSTVACSRAGKPVGSKKSRSVSKRAVRTDCKARINIRACQDGKFYLSGFMSKHNHDLSPESLRNNRCSTSMGPRPEIRVESDEQLETHVNNIFLLTTGNENVNSGNEESINYMARCRSLRLGEGDVESISNYFACMQKQDPNFFCVSNMNEECYVRNVFWADGRSQSLYESFGDVIAFETKYLNSEYKLPLVSFVGVNHHGQSTLLGCGLLFHDDKKSFLWLFRSWLKCMCGRPPKAIVTDQSPIIQEAVSEVFPRIRHRLCLQDIMKKISSNLGGLPNYLANQKELKSIVFESLTIQEFEESWELFIKEFKLENIYWLNTLYLDRAKWVPAFLKRTFWAGMSAIENVNGYFDGYLQPETTLKQFMELYNTVLKSNIENEEHADFKSSSSTIPTITHFPFEKQFQDLYTSEMFRIFQEELEGLKYCNTSLVKSQGQVFTYEVRDFVKRRDGLGRKVVYEVVFDGMLHDVWCKCCLFEFCGILCRHAVAVLFDRDVMEVPSSYILSRWRKDINRKHKGINTCSDLTKTNEQMVRFGKLRTTCHPILEIGAESEQSFELAMKLLEATKDRMLKHKLRNRGNTEGPRSSLVKDGDEVQYSCELYRVLAKLHKKRKRDAHRADA